MWYKLAQNVETAYETLKTKGVSEDTINKLKQLTDIPLRGKYIGALMQNPSMPWDELEEKFSPKQEMKVSIQETRYLSDLNRMLSNSYLPEEPKANFYKWVDRVALPSYRPNQHDPENYTYPKFSQMPYPIFSIQRELDHVYDWYCEHIDENPRFNIFSMSLDNALQASNEWHEELANQTNGSKFTKIKKENGKIVDPNVVMVFDEDKINSLGLSKEYVDWMIVKLTVESDFKLEADIMGNCLGNSRWFDQYKNRIIEIYSLRDESNQPHVSINIELPDTVEQIQGKGNRKPKEDYLKLVQQWIYKNNYYAKSRSYQQDFSFSRGGSESSALESLEGYLNPYSDENETDDYGVPIRPNVPDGEEFVESFDIDNLINAIGNTTAIPYLNPSFYKSTKEISDGDELDKLVEYVGDMYLNYDVNLLREYANEYYAIGMNIKEIKDKLKISKIKESLIDYIYLELEIITDPQSRKFREQEFGPAQTVDFYNKTPEAIDEIALSPYQRQPTRGRAKVDENGNDILKEYGGIYDVYSVFFTDSLYDYMSKNLSSEFYSLANKIGLNLDLSPITPSSVVETYNNQRKFYVGRNPQLTLFSTERSFDGQKQWVYSFNNKKFRLAAVQDEGISDFGYKDLIKPSNDISEEQIVENIKNYYISEVMKHFALETPDYDSEFYASMIEELHSMWEEYIDDIKKGDITSLERVIKIVTDYDLTLHDNSIEHEKLSEMLTSGEIAVALKRNS